MTGASSITLSDTCTLVAANGWQCAMPLRNGFATDVVGSPFLMPTGITSTMTHEQLSQVFSDANMARANVSGASGVTLYQQMLVNAYSGTLPVDMVEVPSTGDLAYITPTALHVLSSKGVILQDYQHYPYCLAHNAILCPTGQFGSVGGTCQPCPVTTSVNPTVAEQIQCVMQPASGQRRLLSNMQSPPAITFTLRTSFGILKEEIDLAICRYMMLRGHACDVTPSQISTLTPANVDADQRQAGNSSRLAATLYGSLIASATRAGIVGLRNDTTEFSMSWVIQSTSFADSQIAPVLTPVPGDWGANPVQASNLRVLGITADDFVQKVRICDFFISRGSTRKYLQCAVKSLRGIAVNVTAMESSRRRLLGLPAVSRPTAVSITEQNAATYISTTAVSFPTARDNQTGTPTPQPKTSDSGGISNLAIIGISAGVGGVVLVIVVVLAVCSSRSPPSPAYTQLKSQ